MSKKKGVSAEQKRSRMLELFYESKSFYQLKDLERIAPREKGIIANSVKDVIAQLVDAGLVDTDKIGTSIYFWAFPSKAYNARKHKLEDVKKDLATSQEKLIRVSDEVEKLNSNKDSDEERNVYFDKIVNLTIERDELAKKLTNFDENNVEALEKVKDETTKVKEATNRWVDNIFSLRSWCNKNFMIEGSTFDKQFGIPDNFDYIE